MHMHIHIKKDAKEVRIYIYIRRVPRRYAHGPSLHCTAHPWHCTQANAPLSCLAWVEAGWRLGGGRVEAGWRQGGSWVEAEWRLGGGCRGGAPSPRALHSAAEPRHSAAGAPVCVAVPGL